MGHAVHINKKIPKWPQCKTRYVCSFHSPCISLWCGSALFKCPHFLFRYQENVYK